MGVTGSVLARAFADLGYKVHAYEATPKLGGLAQTHQCPFTLEKDKTKGYFLRTASFSRVGNVLYLSGTWHDWCDQLLDHPNIRVLRVAPVYRVSLFSGFYDGDVLYNTVRPDILCGYRFGELPTYGGIPIRTDESVALHGKYVEYLQRYNVICIGMSAQYTYMSIEDCIDVARKEVQRVQSVRFANFLSDESMSDTYRQDVAMKETIHDIEIVRGNSHMKNF